MSKTARMDQIPAKFLEQAADVLGYPLSKIINLLVKLSEFLEECKIVKLKLIPIKALKPIIKTTDLFHFSL